MSTGIGGGGGDGDGGGDGGGSDGGGGDGGGGGGGGGGFFLAYEDSGRRVWRINPRMRFLKKMEISSCIQIPLSSLDQ